ncbi:hypothetical protein QP411_00930 [Pseudoglutamicibacter cumminsii]|uniref:hypothetical protein n=1 Tax=Pseudoglutamicibacter cumminsii TaxID=156979 RepID=UPI00255298DE|nr:hypothetical protein [Pseudoglutamicibacter cumminsii]MDK7082490.1 hypothetical protein [Pseudoglutamicibacter cumminsii]
MRKIISTVALVIGVVCLIIGIGLMTWWSPEDRLSAEVPQDTPDAPITMISSDLHLAPESNPEVKLGEGSKFTVVVARPWDIDAWAGSSAVNVIESVDTDERTFKVEHRKGEAKAPNPKGSDLWISESEQDGRWDVTWPEEIRGPIALMVMKDGSEPAPKDLVVTWDNPEAETSVKWSKATPWFVAAVILFGLALILAMSRPKKRTGRRVAESPRRAAAARRESGVGERRPRQGRQAAAGSGAAAAGVVTADAVVPEDARADDVDSSEENAVEDVRGEERHAGLPNFGGTEPYVPQSDDTIVSNRMHGVVAPAEAEDVETEAEDLEAEAQDGTVPVELEEPVAESDVEDDAREETNGDETNDDDFDGGMPAVQPYGGDTEVIEVEVADDEAQQEGGAVNPEDDQRMQSVADNGDQTPVARRRGLAPRQRLWKRLAAAGAALGVAVPAQLAWADPSSDTGAPSTPSEVASSDDEAYSVLVTKQLERIIKDASEVGAKGDKDRDAKKLEARFDGAALTLRKDLYSALKKKVKLNDNLVPPISSKVVTAAVPVDREFPRTVMAVTTDSSKDLPVVVTLKQASAREQYKVVSAVPMVEKATFPGIAVGDPQVSVVAPGDSKDGLMSPDETLKQFTDALADEKSDSAKKFAKSSMVDQLRKANADTKKSYEDDGKGKFTTSYKVDAKSANAVKLPDGSVMVSGSITETMTMTPEKDGGKTTLAGFIREFIGEKETEKPIEARLTIPVVINVKNGKPAEIVGMSYVPVGAELK